MLVEPASFETRIVRDTLKGVVAHEYRLRTHRFRTDLYDPLPREVTRSTWRETAAVRTTTGYSLIPALSTTSFQRARSVWKKDVNSGCLSPSGWNPI